MIFNNRNVFIIISITGLLICTDCSRGKADNLSVDSLQRLKIDLDMAKPLIFSEFFYPPAFIPLETNQYSLISEINQIICEDSIIFIAADPAGLILQFNLDGSFRNSIFNVGRGPDEYMHMYYIWVDKDNQRILLIDSGESIVSMDYQGENVEKIPIKNVVAQALSIHPESGNILIDLAYGGLFNPENIEDNQYFQILIYNISSDSISTWLPMDSNIRTLCPSGFEIWNKTAYYKPRIWDTIYKVGVENIEPKYILDFGKHSKPRELLTTTDEKLTKEIRKNPGFVYEHLKFVETDDYILSTHGVNRGNPILHFRNKITGEVLVFDRYINDYLGDSLEAPLGRYVNSEFNNGLMVVSYQSIELLKNHERIVNSLTANEYNDYMSKNQSYAKVIKELKQDDNPVIAFYYLKMSNHEKGNLSHEQGHKYKK